MVEPTLNLAHLGPPGQSCTHGCEPPPRTSALPAVAARSPKPSVMVVTLLRLMTISVEDVRVWTSPSVVMTVIFRGL